MVQNTSIHPTVEFSRYLNSTCLSYVSAVQCLNSIFLIKFVSVMYCIMFCGATTLLSLATHSSNKVGRNSSWSWIMPTGDTTIKKTRHVLYLKVVRKWVSLFARIVMMSVIIRLVALNSWLSYSAGGTGNSSLTSLPCWQQNLITICGLGLLGILH